MLHKMLQTIDRYRMLEPQQRVVVGFSGGADSTALLFALHQLEQQLDIRVEACHINHCLRGEESERDQQFCTDFCRRYNIPLTVHRIWAQQEAKQAGQSVETFSRQRRYQLLTALAGQQGRVATAHNLNDNAETVLFYLARGTGLNGLGGILATTATSTPATASAITCCHRCSSSTADFCRISQNCVTQPALTSSFCSSWHSRNTGDYSARSNRLLWSGRAFCSCIRQCREGCCCFCCNRCSSSRPMSG